jgi:hypothetical protein
MAKFKFLCYFETDNEVPFPEVYSLGLNPIAMMSEDAPNAFRNKWIPVASDSRDQTFFAKEVCESLNGDNLPQPDFGDFNHLLPENLTSFINRRNQTISLYQFDNVIHDDAISREMSEVGTLVYLDDKAMAFAIHEIIHTLVSGNVDAVVSRFYNGGV